MDKIENSTETKTICPKCHSIKSVIKHGKRNGIQRYKCKSCKCVFPEKRKRAKYFASEKTLLALLLSLINSKKGNIIKDSLKNVPDFLNKIENYNFKERQSTNNNLIFCSNPRLLICENNFGDIILYRISDERTNKEIKIIDEGLVIPQSEIENAE